MSMQLNTLPASAGGELDVGRSLGSRVTHLYAAAAAKIAEWIKLRRQLDEIQALSDRELIDIGLAYGEIHRLRQGDVFCPMNWSENDVRSR